MHKKGWIQTIAKQNDSEILNDHDLVYPSVYVHITFVSEI